MKASMITSIGFLILGIAIIGDKFLNYYMKYFYLIGAILIIIGTLMYFWGRK